MIADEVQERAAIGQLDALAADLGRLSQCVAGDEFAVHLVERIAGRIAILDALFQPTAAQIYQANLAWGAEEDEAAVAALADVDARAWHLRQLFGGKWP